MGGEADAAGYAIPPRYWAWLGTRRAAAVLLWLATLAVASYFTWHAIYWFEIPVTTPEEQRRGDGNGGHAQIDFGGQWVMGRMIVTGRGRELYHRQRHWEVVREAFPVSDESPLAREDSILPTARRRPDAKDLDHDANNMMYWFMGKDSPAWKTVAGAAAAPLARCPFGDPLTAAALQKAAADAVTPAVVEEVNTPAIGGPLYPPVHALLYAPLGLIDRPQTAYHVMQVVGALVLFVAGLGVKVLSRGRIPWSVATTALFLFPGTRSGLDLGQNPTLSLTIVIWGWALASRGYVAGGGAVWGLFAFKPVWGLAFFLVPLLMRRWRFCAAMVLTGAALAAATLPVVGLQAWLDWLQVGQKAAALYTVDHNWIHLSRDLQGVPRRILHDFSLPKEERDTALAKALAWTLWGVVLATTAFVYLRYGDRRRLTGVGAAFLFLGAWLTCYRFMYYDVLLVAMACAVLFADPARFMRTRVFDLRLAPAPPRLTGRGLPTAAPAPDVLGPRLFGYVCSFPLTVLACFLVYENLVSGWDLRATFGFGYFTRATTGAGGETGAGMPRVEFDTGQNYPWETAITFALWAWCAWRLIRGDEREGEGTV